jgi:8-oxo-dGTP diphosphatase
MSSRDGDGWIECSCGNKHSGIHGAAGLLIFRHNHILLQHRAPWVHNGDTWGIPGGARDSHESALEGAFREAVEETGIDVKLLTPVHTFCDDHGNWKYETVIARATDDLVAHEVNDESHELKWIEIEKVESMTLHPSFRNSWQDLKKLLDNFIGPR